MLRLTVEDLARTSDAIVAGRVVRTHPELTARGIVTRATLVVDDWWAGHDLGGGRAPTLELLVHGGRLGDRATIVDGQASFTVGEDVVVFLFEGGGALWPQGLSQGKWRVVRSGAAGPVLAASQADPGALVTRDARGGLVPVPLAVAHETMPLATLRARVRAARGEE